MVMTNELKFQEEETLILCARSMLGMQLKNFEVVLVKLLVQFDLEQVA